jgi:hypothetical protein
MRDFQSIYIVAALAAFELKRRKLAVERLAPIIEYGGLVGRKGQIFSSAQAVH